MSNIDSGLAADTCTFMEAVPGDGGVHDANGIWWISPDIALKGATSGLDQVDDGQDNVVAVKFHRQAVNCVSLGDESITVQFWAGNPSLVMSPREPRSAVLIESVGHAIPPDGSTATQHITWQPPAGLPSTDPQSSGPKCLVARCYSDSLTARVQSFFVPDDPHAAQHNVCVVPCHIAANPSRIFKFNVSTINPGLSQTVTLRARLDTHPNSYLHNVVAARVQHFPGFALAPATTAPGFGFDVLPIHGAHIVSPPQTFPPFPPFPFPTTHGFEATVPLSSQQFIRLTFGAKLTGVAGNGYIFHLTQAGADQHAQGGLTLIMVLV